MPHRLDGKVIVLAGAGGIGDELARRYAEEGASLVLGDIDEATANAAVDGIKASGGTAIAIRLDGADEESIKAAIDLAVSRFGGLDGFHAHFADFSDGEGETDAIGLSTQAYDQAMRVNARGFMLCTRHALPAMIARGGGSMLYTSSAAVYTAEPVRLAYAMSKAAGHALMRHVAARFGRDGIRANTIAPGVVSHARFEAVVPAEFAKSIMAQTAIGTRLGAPADIAAMAALLMSEEGSYITGQVIGVDGGLTMRP